MGTTTSPLQYGEDLTRTTFIDTTPGGFKLTNLRGDYKGVLCLLVEDVEDLALLTSAPAL